FIIIRILPAELYVHFISFLAVIAYFKDPIASCLLVKTTLSNLNRFHFVTECKAYLQGLAAADSRGYFTYKFHVHLETTIGNRGKHFFNDQFVIFVSKSESAVQTSDDP